MVYRGFYYNVVGSVGRPEEKDNAETTQKKPMTEE
jgi:hypothetical protein